VMTALSSAASGWPQNVPKLCCGNGYFAPGCSMVVLPPLVVPLALTAEPPPPTAIGPPEAPPWLAPACALPAADDDVPALPPTTAPGLGGPLSEHAERAMNVASAVAAAPASRTSSNTLPIVADARSSVIEHQRPGGGLRAVGEE
jgi:hypothetical protein